MNRVINMRMLKSSRKFYKIVRSLSKMTTMDENILIENFEKIGIKHDKAVETARNPALSRRLFNLIQRVHTEHGHTIKNDEGILLYTAASHKFDENQLNIVVKYILSRKIRSGTQIKAAFDYFYSNIQPKLDIQAFELASGIDVTYDSQELESAIIAAISKIKPKSKGGELNRGAIIGLVLKGFKWADIDLLNSLVDKHSNNVVINPVETVKTEPVKIEPRTNFKDWKSVLQSIDPTYVYSQGEPAKFHPPGKNYLSPGYVVTKNTEMLMVEHLKKYGNQVRTRFPPEPNGILHIGHAKAINFNFGYAQAHDGITFLRYDDTNPEKEEARYFEGILDMVKWLGFQPYKITHSSDYFDILYGYAIKLINKNLAYVCHMEPNLVKGKDVPQSPWRDRPIHESLRLFEAMKNGGFKEGEATLRLKYVMEDGKADPVAYRILYTPHHRTGNKWCIYPTYSFTHPLCDSLEGITHSLCTKEFQNQRSFYYWLCNSLEVYCPVQWEYGRLNLNFSIVSKRKILKLIDNGVVNDWDDPRLFTLSGLRRRGVPREAINYFCSKLGITMSHNVISQNLFDSCVREVLNVKAKRVMAVLKPLKIIITNLTSPITVTAPNFPFDTSLGSRNLKLEREIYIDASDFSQECKDADFRRLTPNQAVGLLYASRILKFTRNRETKTCQELECEIDDLTQENKPRAFIQWVSQGIKCQVRLYNQLFLNPNPDDVPGGFLNDINEKSLEIIENCLVEQSVETNNKETNYQFERVGYFYLDENCNKDNVNNKISDMIFNRTIELK